MKTGKVSLEKEESIVSLAFVESDNSLQQCFHGEIVTELHCWYGHVTNLHILPLVRNDVFAGTGGAVLWPYYSGESFLFVAVLKLNSSF